jgi:succinate dehydrogenase flavin-adding protein (antitoxin of CptAB toxin-antitoxin module)
MDAILESLNEVDNILATCKDVHLYNWIFEEDDPETANQMKTNAEGYAKSESLLRKAINGIKNIFRKIKEGIQHIFEYWTADKDEKRSFEQWCKDIQNDDSLKGKKVTFHDYRQLMSQMDQDCAQFEKEYTEFKNSQAEENPNLIKSIEKRLGELGVKSKEVAQAEAASFTIEVAIKYAQQSRAHAKKVQKWLTFDMGLVDAIEQELGSKEVRKFEKKIKKLNSSLKIVRLIAGGREKEYKTIQDAINESTGSIMSLARTHHRARNGAHADQVRSSEKDLVRIGKGMAKVKVGGKVNAWGANHESNQTVKDKQKSVKNMNKKISSLDEKLAQA